MTSIKRTTTFAECDPAGVAFFSRAFEWCHAAYEALVSEAERDYFHDTELALPIVDARADYRLPLTRGETIVVKAATEEVGESSYKMIYEILDEEGRVATTARTVHVCVSKQERRAVSIPDDLRDLLNRHRAEAR
ncbi:MAG: hypothetical protein GF419_13235 [Ignavibacteriales bacterium]|nr:hypothetical protein [Ignavibacteriales bacterium]